jgi:DNA-binding transcriptional LysR family regulator
MEIQQLLGFHQVAKLGSFTKAAEATFRSQSALSQQVKALEEELDCRLLERLGKRRLRLTAAGEKLLAFAESLLAGLERVKEELNDLKGLPQGRLSLAAPFTTLLHLLPQALKTYRRLFPQVDLTLLDRPQQAVLALVKNGDVDLGLALESLVPGDLAAHRWLPVETVLLAPPGHPLAALKRVSLRQIARYPLILPPRGQEAAGRRLLEEHFRKLGLSYHVLLESTNVELSALYVEMGLGVSFATLARGARPLTARNLAFIPLKRYFKPDYLAVVRRRDRVLTPYKKAFINLLFGDTILPQEPGKG